MFIQTQQTPNPNSLKFLTEKKVSLVGPIEFKDKSETSVSLIKNILSINGVTGIFLSDDYLSVNKEANSEWEDLKHIIISYINDFYDQGNECIISEKKSEILFVPRDKLIKNIFSSKLLTNLTLNILKMAK